MRSARTVVLALLAIALLPAAMPVAAQAPARARTRAAPLVMDKIILVGDSLMAPISGWGATFCARHVASSISCLDLGRGGRSTRDYRDEGSWGAALNEASVHGYRKVYVLIGFAHNDGTERADRPQRWTELDHEFPDNLRRFVTELRAVGATPILTTPIARRIFRDGRLTNGIRPYSDKVAAVAAEMGVPLIDLNRNSIALYEAMGRDAADRYAQAPKGAPPSPAPPVSADGPQHRFDLRYDSVHLDAEGSETFAAMVARDLARTVPDLRDRLAP